MIGLPTQVIWNGVPFGFLRGYNTYLPVEKFTMRAGVKIEADEETRLSKVTGRELQEATIVIRATNTDIVDKKCTADPRLTFEALNLLKGLSGPIFITAGVSATLSSQLLDALQTSDWRKIFSVNGAVDLAKSLLIGNQMGDVDFMLTSVDMDATGIHPNGEIWQSTITLNLTEDAGQRQGGGLVVYVNDKDITNKIAVHACTYEMHAEGTADTLEIVFSDTKKEWDKWKPSDKGDTCRITDGAVDSGKMFISRIDPQNGTYKLTASSVPKTAYKVRSRSFNKLSLPQLAAKIAAEHKLKCKTYSVPETAVEYTAQQGISDLAFLQRECDRKGCSFLVFDGTLCVYSQSYIEGREPSKTLTPGISSSANVVSDAQSAYSSCELRNGTYTGTATDPAIHTDKIFRESVTDAWQSQADANAAAASRLRLLNKATQRAVLEMSTQRQLTAGSVFRLVCKGWAGPAFIYRIRHDLLKKRSKIWVRKPLSY